mgnify:CR=1 FL=1
MVLFSSFQNCPRFLPRRREKNWESRLALPLWSVSFHSVPPSIALKPSRRLPLDLFSVFLRLLNTPRRYILILFPTLLCSSFSVPVVFSRCWKYLCRNQQKRLISRWHLTRAGSRTLYFHHHHHHYLLFRFYRRRFVDDDDDDDTLMLMMTKSQNPSLNISQTFSPLSSVSTSFETFPRSIESCTARNSCSRSASDGTPTSRFVSTRCWCIFRNRKRLRNAPRNQLKSTKRMMMMMSFCSIRSAF